MPSTTTRRLGTALVAGAALMAVGLSGCSVDVSSDEDSQPSNTNTTVENGSGDTTDDSGDTAAAGAEVTLSSDSTHDCNGGDVVVTSVSSEVTLTGSCGSLVVEGTDAIVHAESITSLTVQGADATIEASTIDSVTVQVSGVKIVADSVRQLETMGTDPTVETRTGTVETVNVTGTGGNFNLAAVGDVQIGGTDNTLTSRGSITSVTATGSGNEVYWHTGQPEITNVGINNTFKRR